MTTSIMNGINFALMATSIGLLFVLWNYKTLFSGGKNVKIRSTNKRNDHSIVSESQEGQVANLIVNEILSLNRAVHTLTQNGRLLDRILKMDPKTSCEALLRDYELSSVMVMVKHEEHGQVQEGFKKITSEHVASSANEKESQLAFSRKHEEKSGNESTSSSSPPQNDPHHSETDPLRIAFYCKNLARPPHIGRAVRLVDSIANPDEQYIVELVK